MYVIRHSESTKESDETNEQIASHSPAPQAGVRNDVEIIKGDREPIGHAKSMTPFTNHSLALSKGDSIYLFTDGYPDQFGGPDIKKIGYKKLRELLFDFAKLEMQEQKHSLENYFDLWMEYEEQIDDVCVIGIKL